MSRRIFVVGLMLAWAGPASAQSPRGALDSIFTSIRNRPETPAIGMVVVHRGKVVYRNIAGFADLERLRMATPGQRFDVASIAKQFTAFAVSQLVEQGRMDPGDPVSRYLPELGLGGTPVTVQQLLDHTSGIEDVDGLLVLSGYAPEDPVGFEDVLRPLLAQTHLRFRPGDKESYGNGGYVLLAEIVQRISGLTFGAFADSLIFRPLRMHHTGFPAGPNAVVPDRALPYQQSDSGMLELSRVDTYAGPGGMYSTLDDMASWLVHLLKPKYQAAATLRLRERGRLNSGEVLGYGWGLASRQYRGQLTLLHSGSGAASEAQMLIVPGLDFGIFAVAAGPTGQNPTTLAYRAVDLFLADSLAPREAATGRQMMMLSPAETGRRPPESEGVTVSPERLKLLAGTYRIGDGPILVVRVGGDHLELGWDGRQPYLPLFPLPDGRFVMVPLWEAYRFETDNAGRPTGLIRERTAKSLRRDLPAAESGSRLPDAPPFDSVSAAPYLGVYCSEELTACYQVSLLHGRLALRHPRHGTMMLAPLSEGRFAVDSRRIVAARFSRSAGRVIGMELEAYSWNVKTSFRKISTGP